MLTRDKTKEIQSRAKAILFDTDFHEDEERALAQDVVDLLEEIDRMKKIHSEEQGRSADRLREVLKNAEA